jgi:hypothetical protein
MEDREEKVKDPEIEKKKKKEEKIPYCTTAPSPEHTRAEEEDEPCDDFRTGE